MFGQNFKLGDDLCKSDNILDAITFEELILTVHLNRSRINPAAVKETAKEILNQRLEDMHYLIENNLDEIIQSALDGRENY